MKKNSEYRAMAAKAMSGKWVTGAVATLVYILVSFALNLILGENLSFLTSLLILPMAWGLTVMFLDVIRGGKPQYSTLIEGYKGGNLGRNYASAIALRFLVVSSVDCTGYHQGTLLLDDLFHFARQPRVEV